MRFKMAAIVLALAAWPGTSQAVIEDNFLIRNTDDLVEICSTNANDPLYGEAVNFCQGYILGAYHHSQAVAAGPRAQPIVCLPNPAPSRNEAIAMFVSWAQAHPQYDSEPAIQSLFRFATETWPCRR